ncbi:hypothetical protein Hanom_Chr01g00091351 [Helianthus anomalus]
MFLLDLRLALLASLKPPTFSSNRISNSPSRRFKFPNSPILAPPLLSTGNIESIRRLVSSLIPIGNCNSE